MTHLSHSVDLPASTRRDILSRHSTIAPIGDTSNLGGCLRALGPVLNFAQNRDIYEEGDEADIFYKVVSGVVRTCKFLGDGRRQIDAFHIAGDLFGLEMRHSHSLCAEAVSGCTVISYRRRGIEALAANDEVLSRQLFLYAMRNLARAQEHSLLLGRGSAVEKVAAFLIEVSEPMPDAKVISLAMTRQDIGDYLGLTVETVSRTFSQLEREAFIELPSARQIWVKDRDALRRLNA